MTMTVDEFQIPFAVMERCLPPELHKRWQKEPLITAMPFLPLASGPAGPVLWKVSRALQWFKLVAPEHFDFFEMRLREQLSLPFATFDDVKACLDSRNEWGEETLFNISRDYPNSMPTFRDGNGRAVWRISDLSRYHCRLYGRREFDRTIRFEETLRAITRAREACG